MGYYDDGQFRSTRKPGGGNGSPFKWIAVAVVAAIVGSGTTLAAIPVMMQSGILTPPVITDANLQPTTYKSQQLNLSTTDAIVTAVKKVTPSVVGVINLQLAQTQTGATALQEAGVGSGIIFDPRGYIVTNNHVVEGASKVEVVLDDKKHVYADVVGTDPSTDLAVLKIPGNDITSQDVAQFGNSDTLQPGEPAIAIGNPAGLDFTDSVTVGVISATQRTMPVTDEQTGAVLGQETVLQTDAAINPGNSGGPLVNALGQVIGINSSKIVSKGFEGMGFAIPINEVRLIVGQIVQYGHALHPALGITGQSLASVPQEYQPNVPVNYGVWVYQVSTPGAKASGLQHGDVIVGVDGHKITGLSDLKMLLMKNYKPGQTVTLTVYRGQQQLTLKLKLSDLGAEQAATQTPSQGGSSGNNGGFNFGNGFTFP